jgi:hypothetical protein
MPITVNVTTTGTSEVIAIDDLGGKVFHHPVVNRSLLSEYTVSELEDSIDLQASIDAGEIVLKDANGGVITHVLKCAIIMTMPIRL